MVDWLSIRNEYIHDTTFSYRSLAEKHGVSFGTLRARAEREKWVEQRRTAQHDIYTQAAQKTVEKASDALSDEAASKAKIRASIMRLAEGWFVALEGNVAELGADIIDPADFRRMVQVYKDLCEIDNPSEDENGLTGIIIIPEVTSIE